MGWSIAVYCRLAFVIFTDLSTLSCDSGQNDKMTAIGEISLSLRFPSNETLPFLSYPQISVEF